MKQYKVTGMSCAACSAGVEKAVSGVEGVTACAVNLLTGSMGVEGTADAQSVIAAVQRAGYGASAVGEEKSAAPISGDPLKDTQTPKLIKRLIASVCLLLPLMYVSMGHTMLGWPLPAFLEGNHIAVGLVQLLLSAATMAVNQSFFISGWKGLWRRSPNMDTLVALGSAASFGYSVCALFAMTGAQAAGDAAAVEGYMHGFYFESAAMILTLITVGKLLEARSKGKTTDAIRGLIKLAPKTAVVLKNGVETEVSAEQVAIGDVFVVRPGGLIPVDGRVEQGRSAVNEAALTGESIPADKVAGDSVFAASVNQSGFLTCRATAVGQDTALAQIIRMVGDASATKAPIAKIADRVSGVFVPAVMGIAAVTFAVWMLAGQSAGFALARAVCVLVISCPCALGLATPVAIMVGSGVGAKNGIMFKTAVSLEQTGKVKIAVLDKTGTVTEGRPAVTDVMPAAGFTEKELLNLACALERKSEHPLAKAITQYAQQAGISAAEVGDFEAVAGSGLRGSLNGEKLYGGNREYISRQASIDENSQRQAEQSAQQGKTPLFFSKNGQYAGFIAVADTVRADSQQAISQLRNMGMRVVMLTGDNERTARAIGAQAGVEEVIAGVLPDGKAEVISRLRKEGRVAMVGDGINDAPALTGADIGIAIGAGTDIAIDAADVVLMHSRLSDVPAAIRLSRATLRNIRQNLFWAFFYNVICIPLAAGVWIPAFGLALNPMFGAAAMSLSSFCVVVNSLRLNFVNIQDGKRDKPGKNSRKNKAVERKETMIIMKVEGMMCSHCENRVKQALEELEKVESATADAKTGEVSVKTVGEIEDCVLTQAVEKAGYTVTGLRR